MCTQTVECLRGCTGVLCASWEVFVSIDGKVHTGVQGLESFSPQLHACSFRFGGLSAFHKALPRFQAWHHSDMSIQWAHWVRSLPCPLRTTCRRSPRQHVVILQVSFSVAPGAFPQRASQLCRLSGRYTVRCNGADIAVRVSSYSDIEP